LDLSTVFESLQQILPDLQNYLPDLQSLDLGSWLPNVEPILQQAQQILAELWASIGGLI